MNAVGASALANLARSLDGPELRVLLLMLANLEPDGVFRGTRAQLAAGLPVKHRTGRTSNLSERTISAALADLTAGGYIAPLPGPGNALAPFRVLLPDLDTGRNDSGTGSNEQPGAPRAKKAAAKPGSFTSYNRRYVETPCNLVDACNVAPPLSGSPLEHSTVLPSLPPSLSERRSAQERAGGRVGDHDQEQSPEAASPAQLDSVARLMAAGIRSAGMARRLARQHSGEAIAAAVALAGKVPDARDRGALIIANLRNGDAATVIQARAAAEERAQARRAAAGRAVLAQAAADSRDRDDDLAAIQAAPEAQARAAVEFLAADAPITVRELIGRAVRSAGSTGAAARYFPRDFRAKLAAQLRAAADPSPRFEPEPNQEPAP